MKKATIYILAAVFLLISAESLFAEKAENRPEVKRQGKQKIAAKQKAKQTNRGQSIDNLLNKLTAAYEDNDREEMGRLLKKIHQQRKQAKNRNRQGVQKQGREDGKGPHRKEFRGEEGKGWGKDADMPRFHRGEGPRMRMGRERLENRDDGCCPHCGRGRGEGRQKQGFQRGWDGQRNQRGLRRGQMGRQEHGKYYQGRGRSDSGFGRRDMQGRRYRDYSDEDRRPHRENEKEFNWDW